MSERYTMWLDNLQNIGVMTLFVFLALLALFLLRSAYSLIHSLKQKYTLLKVTPAAFTDKPAQATETLFNSLHGLGMSKTITDKLLGRKTVYACEIRSTKQSGIEFFVRVPESKVEATERLIESYLSDAKVEQVEDYLTKDHKSELKAKVLSFKQAKHYAYPLKAFDELEQQDPVGYITSAMTKLNKSEQIVFQINFTPRHLREANNISKKILKNKNVIPNFNKRAKGFGFIAAAVNRLLFGALDIISTASNPNVLNHSTAQKDLDRKQQIARDERPARQLSYFEHELVDSINQKLSQPLFAASVRALVVAGDQERTLSHKKALASAMSLFAVPKYQNLKLVRTKHPLAPKLSTWLFNNRLPKLFSTPNYFGSKELANLFHFPNSESAKTDNVIKSLSKTLPAPISLKDGTELDVLFGENIHHGQTTPIGLTAEERQRHMYVIGGTGNGKTTLLKYQIVQDMKAGKGVAVVDPHGDLAEELLGLIPKDRMDDVVYINPDDLEHPVGINLLELPTNLDGSPLEGTDLLREKDSVTESTISVLRKIFSEDDSGGHRIEYVLRNTIQTALTLPEANLFTIFRLLNDAKFRKRTVKSLQDQDLKNFWKQEIGKAGDMQRVKMAAGITAKIGRFLFSASARGMLEQNKSRVDFEKLMDEGKILICNFSKGNLGEDTSALFGITILAKLQLASLRRSKQAQANRSPFYLYVDEFQNFATMGFVQMLSEARKYKLFLTMAEQSTQQQDEQRLVEIILANVGTVVAFRSGSPKDEQLILPLFKPFIEEGEIANLPAYSFYTRISAIQAQEPLSGRTVLLEEKENSKIRDEVAGLSRRRYRKKVDGDIDNTECSAKPKKAIQKQKLKKELKTENKNKPNVSDSLS